MGALTLGSKNRWFVEHGQSRFLASSSSLLIDRSRHRLLGDDLLRHQEDHGAFTEEELSEARAKIFGASGSAGRTDAA